MQEIGSPAPMVVAGTPHSMRIGEFDFYPGAGELRRGDVACRLQPQTAALLLQFVEHAGEVLTREDLHKSLWKVDTFVGFDDGLNHAVARLREAFGDAARRPSYIETVPRRGYRLIAPVAPIPVALPEVPPVGLPDPPEPPRAHPRVLGLAAVGLAVLASVVWLLTSRGAGARTAGGVDAAAYEEYVKGNIEIERYGDLRAVERALQHYRAAAGHDARFAPAQAGIAIAYMQKMMYESEPARYLREASEAAHRAVDLDPGLADGHLAVGRLESFYKWNWVAADQAFARALPLHPSQPFARNYYSAYLTALGRYEEAVAFTRATLALAPHSLSAHTMLAQAYLAAGMAPDAADVARRALSIDPTFSPMHRFLALAYLETEPARAIEESKTILVPDEASVLAIRAAIAACAGARADALALRDKLNQLRGVRYVRPTRMAQLETCLGDSDAAFRWLEEGVRDHELDMAMVASFPLLRPLRADPRFAKILASMNFPAAR